MNQPTLGGLRRQALTSTANRGHVIKWQEQLPYRKGRMQYGDCAKCGLAVRVCTDPLPNEIEIGGEALALTCQPV
jgi:hypothetical protein